MRILVRAASSPADNVATDFRVTRKGCGRGSGEAPRALKTIILSRLRQNGAFDNVEHIGGDKYRVSGIGHDLQFVFRTTTASRYSETGRPWFNMSATEIASLRKENTLVLVCAAALGPDKSLTNLEVSAFDPNQVDDFSLFRVKPSEPKPTAVFELKDIDDGKYLVNLTAREMIPPSGPLVSEVSFFSQSEAGFLVDGYGTKHPEDRTSGGKFKPITVLCEPGDAPDEEIADFLAEVSVLYRMISGSGISFELTDARVGSEVLV